MNTARKPTLAEIPPSVMNSKIKEIAKRHLEGFKKYFQIEDDGEGGWVAGTDGPSSLTAFVLLNTKEEDYTRDVLYVQYVLREIIDNLHEEPLHLFEWKHQGFMKRIVGGCLVCLRNEAYKEIVG
jgi:hypothetical protein